MAEQDLLIEIGTEELPPKALSSLSQAFVHSVEEGLKAASLTYAAIEPYATPRRLAMIIRNLQTRQPDSTIEKLGPAIKAAFDNSGKPTKAAEGFARSCGVDVKDLCEHDDGKVIKLLYRADKPGQETRELIPEIVRQALAKLPIPKRMRWGASRVEFVRPVHWAVLLFGADVIPATILGLAAGNVTHGHRFHHPDPIVLHSPDDYTRVLKQDAYVIADFDERREIIRKQVEEQGKKLSAQAIIDEDLLNEVTSLVEWPVALTGNFDTPFLDVPKEALISSMKEHQRCFYLLDDKQQILPHFITVSNLASQDIQQVIHGNEKVIRPRLADAAFFYQQDKKHTLEARREKLKSVIFQHQLGTVYDKTERVAALATFIAEQLGNNPKLCQRAAQLAKCDLVTSMVYEFAELQGIMGYYYALNDGEDEEVAKALDEQYLPRYAGDKLPLTATGTVLALAERIDTMVGLFGIGQPPTGSKDPFALRRAALGILRILVEGKLDLDLAACISKAISAYDDLPQREGLEGQVIDFIFDRLRSWYGDRGISPQVFMAVDAVRPVNPLEFDLRVNAVNRFTQLPEAESLSAANKRVANILSDIELADDLKVNESLFEQDEERNLFHKLDQVVKHSEPQFQARQYTDALETLASLQLDVDRFFDKVMVNAEDEKLRSNRLALLQQLRRQFLRIADISLLQT